MTDNRTCRRCGSPLVSARDGAVCPACLINAALEDSTAELTVKAERGGPGVVDLSLHPKQIGPYVILDTLGQGGMGVVYLAEQIAPIRRRVALKLIRAGRESHQVIARFDAERQTLALMDHPNIASVFDAGSTDDGLPYFVMEYVPGLPITEFCDTHRLSTRTRLELFQQVCSAVQHAHQKGIIHRDLKPSNVLVMDQDGRPLPKVIDFGVARAIEQRLVEQSLLTEHGVLIGTPEYMSPEQAGSGADVVDTRTDIYSLGVLLYELLVGGLPFTPAELRRAGLAEIQRVVRESEPRKPSTKLSDLGANAGGVADRRQTSVSTLTRELRGDLDWITLKAIEKEPARRYASASELSADISRHLEHEPVAAGPPSTVYRLRKLVRKHRGAVAAAAALIIILVSGLAVSTAMYVRAERSRNESLYQAYRSAILAADLSLQGGEAAQARQQLESTDPRFRGWEWRYLTRLTDTSIAATSRFAPQVRDVRFSRDGNSLMALGDTLAATAVFQVRRSQPLAVTRQPLGDRIVAISPDGSRVLTSTVVATSPEDESSMTFMTPFMDLRLHPGVCQRGSLEPTSVTCKAESSHSQLTAGDPGRLVVRDVVSGAAVATLIHPNVGVWRRTGLPPGDVRVFYSPHDISFLAVTVTIAGQPDQIVSTLSGRWPLAVGASFSQDGGRVATWSWDNTIYVWDVAKQSILSTLRGHRDGVRSVSFDRTGDRVLSASWDGTVRVWNVSSGKQLQSHSIAGAATAAWAPGGQEIAVGTDAGTIEIWEVAGGRVVRVLAGHTTPVTSVAFSPDGSQLVTSGDRTAKLWEVSSGAGLLPFNGHEQNVLAVAYSADGNVIATGAEDGTIRLWNPHPPVATLRGHRGRSAFSTATLAFSAAGDHLVSAANDGTARVWDLSSGESTSWESDGPSDASKRMFISVVASPPRIVLNDRDQRQTRVIDLLTGRTLMNADWVAGPAGWASPSAFSPDGSQVAVASRTSTGGTIAVREANSGRSLATWTFDGAPMGESIAFSGDGRRIAVPVFERALSSTGDALCRIVIFERGSSQPVAALSVPFMLIQPVFLTDGSGVVYGEQKNFTYAQHLPSRIHIWEFGAKEEVAVLSGHNGMRLSIAVSPDGSRLVSGGDDQTLRFWDLGHRQLLLTMPFPAPVTAVAISPDGARIAVGLEDGVIKILDAGPNAAARGQAPH